MLWAWAPSDLSSQIKKHDLKRCEAQENFEDGMHDCQILIGVQDECYAALFPYDLRKGKHSQEVHQS